MSKVILPLIILILFSLTSATTSQESLSTLWGAWKASHNKHYTPSEESHRFTIFQHNIAKIAKLNVENPHTKFAINKFADLTNSEFKKRYANGLIKPRVSSNKESHTESINITLPTSIDWRTQGVVTPVKDQGSCGSCWAFTAVGAIESLYKIKGGALTRFSEQQLVDCSWAYGNYGCSGGLADPAFAYAVQYGNQKEIDYPYVAQDQTCKYDANMALKVIYDWKEVSQGDLNQLKAFVAISPVSVGLDSSSDLFQFYSSGVITSTSCGTDMNHGGLVVGYQTVNAPEYFIVKNSWGNQWGMNGYVHIASQSVGSGGICGILLAASTPR